MSRISGISKCLIVDSKSHIFGIMKTTVDIPDKELADAMKFTRARSKREAIVTAITEFNQRRRMADLVKYSGTSHSLITTGELKKLRRKG